MLRRKRVAIGTDGNGLGLLVERMKSDHAKRANAAPNGFLTAVGR